MTTESDAGFFKRRRQRLLSSSIIVLVLAWGFLELMRSRAEHQSIPVFVIVKGPPTGPMAAQMKAAGITAVGMPLPYEQATNPPVSIDDIAAMKRCLAREKLFPLFPAEIQVSQGDVTAHYGMRINRRTGRSRETVVPFTHETNGWHLGKAGESSGTADFIRPPTLWDKVLSYLPFTD